MRSTGIVRPLDQLGRVVLPIELRRTLDLSEKDSVEIFVDGEQVILKKYRPGCILCENVENLIWHKGKNFCPVCLDELKKK